MPNKIIQMCPPPVLALILLGIAIGIDQLVPGFPNIPLPDFGMVLAAVGGGLAVSALLWFRRFGTTALPHGTPSALVTDGPYQWTRNPMYLGLLTTLFGSAFFLGSLLTFVAPVGFLFCMNRFYIPSEEERLSGLFGLPFNAYLEKVQRWI